MTESGIGADLMGRIMARAGDPARASDSNALAANSVGFETILEGMPKSSDPEVRAYLEGMNTPPGMKSMVIDAVCGDGGKARGLMGMVTGLLGGKTMFGMMGGTPFSIGGTGAPPAVRAPASEAQVAAAEAALGFALPPALRQLYLEVGDGGFGPGDGLFSLDRLVARHRELTREPVGPQGQDWPEQLLPIHGADWELVAIDRITGRLVFWDVEDLNDEEEDEDEADAAWNASFIDEAPSLAAWLERWLGEPTLAERMARERDQVMAQRTAYASEESIERFHAENPDYSRRLAIFSMTPEERAAIGLPEKGWEEKVWEGFDFGTVRPMR